MFLVVLKNNFLTLTCNRVSGREAKKVFVRLCQFRQQTIILRKTSLFFLKKDEE